MSPLLRFKTVVPGVVTVGAVVAVGIAFVGYATLVSHAERPCLVTDSNPCTKYLQPAQK